MGKVIQFRILYTVSTGAGRQYGTITLQDGQQLPDLSVAEGYLKLRDDAGKREENEDVTSYIDKLRVLEARAKADAKGLWDVDSPKIQTSYEVPNPKEFAEKWYRKPMDGTNMSFDFLVAST